MQKIYHEFKRFATPFLEEWERQEENNFFLLSWAFVLKRTCCLAHLSRALPFEITAQSKVNRFFRFLNDEKAICPDDFFAKDGLVGF